MHLPKKAIPYLRVVGLLVGFSLGYYFALPDRQNWYQGIGFGLLCGGSLAFIDKAGR